MRKIAVPKYCGPRRGYAANTAGRFCVVLREILLKHVPRELAEPQKLLTYLLQPKVLILAPDIISVYLQAAIKVFGSWTAELADRWDDDDLPKVRETVDTVVQRVSAFASNPDIEVQERVGSFAYANSHMVSSNRGIHFGIPQ